jgi:hypothetical protein
MHGILCICLPLLAFQELLSPQMQTEDDMDGCRVVQRLVNGETIETIARSFGYRSPTPVIDAAREFIITKLGHQRYEALARQPGVGCVHIVRLLGKEALGKD